MLNEHCEALEVENKQDSKLAHTNALIGNSLRILLLSTKEADEDDAHFQQQEIIIWWEEPN